MAPRRLVLVRHAEAGPAPLDRDRPLTERGARQATAVGEWLAGLGVAPDRVVVSPARRALQTWDGLRAAVGRSPERVVDERIYDNTLDALFEVVRDSGDVAATLVVVGHNPAVGSLAHVLDDGAGEGSARQDLAAGFPPAAAAVFDVATPFADIDEGGATLVAFRGPAAVSG